MNRRQKIIVSITGIFLVMLILTGLTYAYYLTRITGNTNETSISLSTAKLELVYSDGNGIIEPEGKITPGNTIGTKTFSVENKGNKDIEYSVVIKDLNIYYVNTFTRGEERIEANTPTSFGRPEDFIYNLTCTSSNLDENTKEPLSCGEKNEVMFPTTEDIILNNSIEQGETHSYTFELIYQESNTNQSVDMNKGLIALIDIIDTKNTIAIKGNVADATGGEQIEIEKQENVAYINGKEKVKLLGNEEENKKVTYVDKDGNYKVVGVQPGNYKVTLKNKDNTNLTTDVKIIKGTTVGVENNIVTITDASRTITMDVTEENPKEFTLSEEIEIEVRNLKEAIIASAKQAKKVNSESRTIFYDKTETLPTTPGKEISGENERVLAMTEDNHTATTNEYSYYFRGDVKDNYVDFANMCWRIVRIAGDDSIKLILQDKNTTCNNKNYSGNWAINDYYGNYGYEVKDADDDGEDEYILNYLKPSKNKENSMVKAFYNFQTNKLSNSLDKLKSGDWCLANKAYKKTGDYKNYEYVLLESYDYTTDMFYEANFRLIETDYEKRYTTLTCNGIIINEFENVSGVSEKTPMYVSAISMDEATLSGADWYTENMNDFYLVDWMGTTSDFWTLTPSQFTSTVDEVFIIEPSSFGFINEYSVSWENATFRPMIALKAGTEIISGGNGTKTNPYVVK